MRLGHEMTRLLVPGRRRGHRLLAQAGAVGLGACLMYFFDPDRGTRRRALARDKSVHAAHRVTRLLDRGALNLERRLQGLAAETRAALRDGRPTDEILVLRTRARLGRAVSHPHAIEVTAQEGRVTLRGPILASEVPAVLSTASAVPGIEALESSLEPHEPSEHLPALQGGRLRMSRRAVEARERWSPLTRIGVGTLGACLVAYGLARRDQVGAVVAGTGAALLVRDIENRPIRRLLGVGAGRRSIDLHKTIHVGAPVEEVYAFFIRVENFPRFMAHLRDVRKLDGDRYHWVAYGPARIPVSWDAEVTERVPNERFAWRSVPGAAIGNAGVVRFERVGDKATRLHIDMSYNPPAGAVGHVIATLFGADPKHAMDEDMVRFKSLLERGKTTAHGERVCVEDIAPVG